MNWKKFLSDKESLYELLFTIILLAVVLLFFPRFLNFVETRPGVVLQDPFLKLFNPIDLTWLIFVLIYLTLIIALINFASRPLILIKTFQSYSLLVIFRTVAMYLTPFNPPVSMLALNDPFVQLFGNGEILTRDLFFSGHTATLFLLFLLAENKWLKTIFLVNTIVVGAAVLLQHVHYTIDVLTAPFFAYGSYRMVIFIKSKLNLNTIGNSIQ